MAEGTNPYEIELLDVLNITSPEENPMVDALVQAISEQGKNDVA